MRGLQYFRILLLKTYDKMLTFNTAVLWVDANPVLVECLRDCSNLCLIIYLNPDMKHASSKIREATPLMVFLIEIVHDWLQIFN